MLTPLSFQLRHTQIKHMNLNQQVRELFWGKGEDKSTSSVKTTFHNSQGFLLFNQTHCIYFNGKCICKKEGNYYHTQATFTISNALKSNGNTLFSRSFETHNKKE